jgi:predicted AAA+ superfamily ATPase
LTKLLLNLSIENKILDEIEDLKILVTGSSAFDLNNKLGEPLTGRKHTVKLYPVAQCEWENYENLIETRSMLVHRMIYGNYPELIHLDNYLDFITSPHSNESI